jgi:hypothetical protein
MSEETFKYQGREYNIEELFGFIDKCEVKLGFLNIIQTALADVKEPSLRDELIEEATETMDKLCIRLE